MTAVSVNLSELFSKIGEWLLTMNSLEDYLLGIGVFTVSILVLRVFKYAIIRKFKILSKRTKSKLDDTLIDMIDSIGWPMYIIFAFYLSLQFVVFPEVIETGTYYIMIVLGAYYLVKSINIFIEYIARTELKSKEVDPNVVDLIVQVTKVSLWIIAALFIISNFGYDISALVAGVGIGGIAIAFALQNILSDIFAFFSIHFDRPFKVGDFVVVGNDSGTVKNIGIKSTRLTTLEGDELVISNKELTESRIHNYKRMEKRRVIFRFGVKYETPLTKLKKIPKLVEEVFKEIKDAELKRVHFYDLGEYALIFEVMYLLPTNDYITYLNIRQEVNYKLMEKFKKNKIEFAYPTQEIFLHK